MSNSADTEKTTIAFIGLGVMGYPMAGHLASKGWPVRVYNRTESKAQAWIEQYGGEAAGTPAQAAEGCDIVFACVGNDDDIRQVAAGPDGAFKSMSPGAIFVDHTTASAKVARELCEIAGKADMHFIDAPVSGGQAGAENGILTVMCGGAAAAFERVAPAMRCYGRAVTLMGDSGSGQLTKMVNQISIAGLVQGLAEALNFASRCGLNEKLVLDVISKGAAQSWQMENRGTTMVDDQFDFGFAVEWMRKDLAICLEEGNAVGARLPVTALVDQFYAEIQAMGGSRWDTSSLIRLLSKP